MKVPVLTSCNDVCTARTTSGKLPFPPRELGKTHEDFRHDDVGWTHFPTWFTPSYRGVHRDELSLWRATFNSEKCIKACCWRKISLNRAPTSGSETVFPVFLPWSLGQKVVSESFSESLVNPWSASSVNQTRRTKQSSWSSDNKQKRQGIVWCHLTKMEYDISTFGDTLLSFDFNEVVGFWRQDSFSLISTKSS